MIPEGYSPILDATGNLQPMSSAAPLYEGTSTGARMGTWGLSAAGPNAALKSLGAGRKRAREMERNNPTAKGGIDSFVSNLVGTDISPSWQLDNDEQREELHQLWNDSQLESDFYGISDFYGTQEIACRSMIRDGEVLAQLHDVDPSLGLIVPLQIQLLEADHLDVNYNDISPDGNEIRFGIEWQNGRRKKYWVYKNHPGENFLTADNISRISVDAADMLHVFRPLRAGQARGMTWLAPIIVKLHDIDIYDDAEVVRKKAAALWGGFIYSDSPVTRESLGGGKGSSSSPSSITLNPGTFPVLKNGQKIAFADTADVGNNYLNFMRVQFREAARGFGITYEQLTGDLSDVNYTSLRAGLIEFRRLCETIVARTLVFQYCRPYVNRWLRSAMLSGAVRSISLPEYLRNPRIFHRVSWNPDGFDFTDPVKDRVAERMDNRDGVTSRGYRIARRGGTSAAAVDRQNRSELASAVDKGLVYDCYPSQTNQSGTLQKIEQQVIADAVSLT
jgi:lambda family phage portal protein